MQHTIATAGAEHFDRLADLWEAAVRATHDFLPDGYIERLRPLVREQYLGFVELRAWRDQGIGKALLASVVEELGVREVDVNEQNPQAVGFYLKQGFVQVGRSEVDGQGDPYPLLHLKLEG
ncbi:GNAT family N-acetyltransferase [uncultured Pseudomonas sp.]|uniref:GNAT family N-acetyltransferase n=1 Tax=uncultured Pseudomonas sp. TaxID=114707 RepID=UPI00258C7A75|nr:GNAT family N-acetyltransferase [uncultured Pseudomonas sp.]